MAKLHYTNMPKAVALCVLGVVLHACVSADEESGVDQGAADAFVDDAQRAVLEEQALAFVPCAAPTGVERNMLCATARHPRRFFGGNPGGEIELGLIYLPARTFPVRGHLWFLTGGPGGSSTEEISHAL